MPLTVQIADLITSLNTITVSGIYIGFHNTLVETTFCLLFGARIFKSSNARGGGEGGGVNLKLRIDRRISIKEASVPALAIN